jgi:hypothetical protein
MEFRIISAGLVPLCVAPFAAGSLNPVTDSILCALLVVHSHIGFEYVTRVVSIITPQYLLHYAIHDKIPQFKS